MAVGGTGKSFLGGGLDVAKMAAAVEPDLRLHAIALALRQRLSMVVWQSMVKVTFTFDPETVDTLRRTASRLKKPQSVVVREAIQDYAARSGRLSEDERRHMLKVFDRMVGRIPIRSQAEADTEIAGIRAARRNGGRRTRPE